MKTKILFIAFICFTCIGMSQQISPPWQVESRNDSVDFFDLSKQSFTYFENYPDIIDIKGSGFKPFIRWYNFWRDRVYEGGSNKSNFKYINDAFLQINTNKNIEQSANSSSNWSLIGPKSLPTQNIGIVVSLLVNPLNNNIIYAGTDASGLWKSVNGGQSWINVTDNIGFPILGVDDVTCDPSNPDILYIATNVMHPLARKNGLGVFKSTDAGNTWLQIGLNFQYGQNIAVRRIKGHPTNSNIIFALVNDKVYRTLDGGSTWSVIFNNLTNTFPYSKKYLRDIEFLPSNPNTIIIASDGFWDWTTNPYTSFPSEIWMSNNANDVLPTWSSINLGYSHIDNCAIATSLYEPNSFWVGYAEGSNFIIQKSSNSGNSWEQLYSFPISGSYRGTFSGTGFWRLELEISPSDPDVLYVGGFVVTKVYSNGTSTYNHQYSPVTQNNKLHIDVRSLFFVQGSAIGSNGANDILLVGNDGGVSKIEGNTCTNINGDGLYITQFYGLGGSEINSEIIHGGTQDNGIFSYNSAKVKFKVLGNY